MYSSEMAPGLQKTLATVKQIPAVQEGLRMLREGLQARKPLTYHSYEHTEDVLKEAMRFALADKLPEKSRHLLAVAAVMHDIGFIERDQQNEPIGAAYAEKIMRRFGYSDEDVTLVKQMILDTALVSTDGALRQIPHTELSKYLLDADLANFGREDFFKKSDLQRQESGMDLETFQIRTLELLESHSWHTKAARTLLDREKQENVRVLRNIVNPNLDGLVPPTMQEDG